MNREPDTIGKKLVSDLPELWTCKDMAQHFGRSTKTIGYIVRSRAIAPVARIGTKKFFDMSGVELAAIGLAELEAVKGIRDRLGRIEADEAKYERMARQYRNGDQAIAELVRQGLESLALARTVIEGADKRINLTPVTA